jgi:hypothetical protein
MKGVFADDSHVGARQDWTVNCRRQRGQNFCKGIRCAGPSGFGHHVAAMKSSWIGFSQGEPRVGKDGN